MVTAKTQYSLKNAQGYFEEHLSVGDYYDQGQRVAGEWFGIGAERLGLAGRISRDEFLRLCENEHPSTGDPLTQRLNTTRTEDGQRMANRRIFFDFTFSPPKSVSIIALAASDDRVVHAHEKAVRSALKEFEAFAGTRVRRGKRHGDRTTDNFVAALFTHDTSRALDPHLHTHCIVFNATFDPVEARWKALQNHGLLQARKFAENAYYHELARELRGFGYQIQNRMEGDFQVVGVSKELCDRFSKRDAQIDAALEKLLQEKPELATANLRQLRADLATVERARKQSEFSPTELRALWDGQMSDQERKSLAELRQGQREAEPIGNNQKVLQEAVSWAEEHLFDRHSVVMECQIWQEALGRARGEQLTLQELKAFTRARGYVRDTDRPHEVTLREVLLRELEIVKTVRDGIGEAHPLVPSPKAIDSRLDGEQQQALKGLLSSLNQVSVFRGGAGTGKSFVLGELVKQVQQAGREVVVLAPQRQQVVDMEAAGFPSPLTVTSFLQKREISSGGVIVVDEAGQIGGQQMVELLRCAKGKHARLILSGDTRQHGPVETSDALVAIEKHSGIHAVELHTIRRQDPARGKTLKERRQIRNYRQAVEAAADGRLAESFTKLEAAGFVTPCRLGTQSDALAEEYLQLAEQKASAVVVSQTWSEVNRLNSKIRELLKAKGLIGQQDHPIQTLDRLDLTNAQKRDQRFYPSGAVILFNQQVMGCAPGQTGRLQGIVNAGVIVEVEGKLLTIQNRLLSRLTVCVPRDLPVTEGDRLHLKANRKLGSGAKVTNGELVTVKQIRPASGHIELTDGRILDPSFREFVPGYAITSYGSQGKTVDYVLFSDSAVQAATNAQQWYVSISRGRKGVRIFTPDKERLREAVSRSGHHPLAMDLLPTNTTRSSSPRQSLHSGAWGQLRSYMQRFGDRAANLFVRIKSMRRRNSKQIKPTNKQTHAHQTTRMLVHRPERPRTQGRGIR